jgi:hypothetical protein
MLMNVGCFNPGTGAGTRWSLYTYGLQPTNDGQSTYVQWMDRQYNELGATLARLACHAPFNPASSTLAYGTAPIDEVATPPLTTNSCSTLWADWRNGRDKLNKCIEATTQPKNSALSQTCNAFKQQFEAFQLALLAAPVNGDDPANRVGELEARTQVLFFLKDEHALPSVPAGGFQP